MNLSIMAPVNNLGYGIAATNLILALDKLGHEVSYFPVTSERDIECPTGSLEIIKKCFQRAAMFDAKAPCLKIWHQFDMAKRVGTGQFYGFPFFELDTFTEQEKHHLQIPDIIFVTSQWAASVVGKNLGMKVRTYVVPLGVDTTVFRPSNITQRPKSTIFMTCGKWEKRKGHDIICETFNKAFELDDNVELWMMCSNPFLNEQQVKEWENMFKSSKLGEKIKFIPRQDSTWDVARIMRMADCGVFPSHGEGWNLELLEMMACGKKVIATNYSAHTEFCTSENTMLVDTFGLEPAIDGVWFNGQGNWSKITDESKDKIVQYLRMIHQDRINGVDMINTAGIKTAEKFTWDNSARKLVNYVCEYNGNS